MKVKKLLTVVTGIAVVSTLFAADPVRVRATRESAVYQIGETVEFKVTGAGENMTYSVADGNEKSQFIPLTGDTVTVKTKKPGFIRVTVDTGVKDSKGKKVFSVGAAAVEPENIRAVPKRPADFDQFWDEELRKMRQHPLEVVRETPIPEEIMAKRPNGKNMLGYEIEVKRGDISVTGFFFVLKDAKPKSLPAVLTFNGASQVTAHFVWGSGMAANFGMAFNTNFHAFPNLIERDKKAEAPYRKKVAGYMIKKADDRDAYAMRKIFLRTALAADYIMSRPEFNGKHLGAIGSSLGGCQAFVCAALVPEVIYCVSNATAMCDHWGTDAGRLAGWPHILNRTKKLPETMAYFDLVNFAPRIKCFTEMSVGFIDSTCPPESTYAAFNALTCEKKMNHTVSGAHGPTWDKKETSPFNHGKKTMMKYFENYNK